MRFPTAIVAMCVAFAARDLAVAGQAYFVSERLGGNIWRIEDRNGDGDALEVDERTLWGTGMANAAGLETDGLALYAVEEGLPGGSNGVVRFVDINGDGDALDVGERSVWADGFVDPRDIVLDAAGRWFVTDFGSDRVWHLTDANDDGDALDAGERMLFADGVDGAEMILPRGGELFVAAFSSDRVHRIVDLNADGDALDVGENQAILSELSQPVGLAGDENGGFFVSSFGGDAIYRARDSNGDGDWDDVAEVLSYADTVFGSFDGPWDLVSHESGGILVANYAEDEILLVRDVNGDGDGLDFGEVVSFATGIDGPVDLVAAPSSFPLPGDINLDGVVNRTDAALFSQFYGTASGGVWTTGDFDLDGATTQADLAILQSYQGHSLAASQVATSVPEPSTNVFLLGGMVVIFGVIRAARCPAKHESAAPPRVEQCAGRGA